MKRMIIWIYFSILAGQVCAQGTMIIELNKPDLKSGLTVMEALSLRASAEEFKDEKLSIPDLSNLLWAANGVNRSTSGKRTAPSAMNAQDIDVYVFVQEGVFLYDASRHILNGVAEGDQRALVADNQAEMAKAAAILVLVSDLARFKTGTDSLKLSWAAFDAGIVSQNISIFCAGAGLKTRTRASMNQQKIREVLQLKDSQHLMLNNPVSY